MDEKMHSEYLTHFKKNILGPIALELVIDSSRLDDGTREEFGSVVIQMVAKALGDLCQYAQVDSTEELPREFYTEIVFHTVRAFNSALNVDHSYILAQLFILDTNKTKFIVMVRDQVIKLTNAIERNDVPIIRVRKEEDLEKTRFEDLNITIVRTKSSE